MTSQPQIPSPSEPVPQLDLSAQYAAIGAEIQTVLERVMASQQFVLGREAPLWRKKSPNSAASRTAAASLPNGRSDFGLRACGVQAGDEVLLPPSLLWPLEAPSVRSAQSRFSRTSPDTYNIIPPNSTPRHSAHARRRRVHLYGLAADMDPILAFAKGRKLPVIEDNAQAIGASYKGRRTGSLGDAACLSFYPTKISAHTAMRGW